MPSREEKKAATREKLLDAAASLVAREGAMAVSLDRIAERAGLTKGAVYSNFSGKEELLFAVATRGAGPTVPVEDILDETTPISEQFERLGREVAKSLQAVSERAWRLGIEVYFYALRNPRARKLLADTERASDVELGAMLERTAAAKGEALPLPGRELALVVEALALGLALKRAIDPKRVPDDLFPRAFRLLAD